MAKVKICKEHATEHAIMDGRRVLQHACLQLPAFRQMQRVRAQCTCIVEIVLRNATNLRGQRWGHWIVQAPHL